MRIPKTLLIVSLGLGSTAYSQTPGLGVPIAEAAVESITVFADGENLPPGSGTVAEGQRLYQQQCAACHGPGGKGGINDPLVGGHSALDKAPAPRTIGSFWPYAVPVFDYIRRAMPYAAPGTLTDDQVYALVAYLLHTNEIIGADTRLDAERLRGVKMPNRERFFSTFDLP